MSDKINSHISLMLSVYRSSHQTVKNDHQRIHILQGLTGLETETSMNASKAENRFSTSENRFAKKPVMLCPYMIIWYYHP